MEAKEPTRVQQRRSLCVREKKINTSQGTEERRGGTGASSEQHRQAEMQCE